MGREGAAGEASGGGSCWLRKVLHVFRDSTRLRPHRLAIDGHADWIHTEQGFGAAIGSIASGSSLITTLPAGGDGRYEGHDEARSRECDYDPAPPERNLRDSDGRAVWCDQMQLHNRSCRGAGRLCSVVRQGGKEEMD